jgi:hypothetical protein
MIKIYPAIDCNGDFEEFKFTDRPPTIWPRAKRTKMPVFPIKLEANINPVQTVFEQEMFEFWPVRYKIKWSSKQFRIVELIVYVSKEFKQGEKNRGRAIDRFIKKYSPWLFSYADRGAPYEDWSTEINRNIGL